MKYYFFINRLCLVYIFNFIQNMECFQITPEKSIELRIRACTHKLKPFQLDTMLV